MENIVLVDEGAEAFIELLNANGVDYIFLNPGTDTYLSRKPRANLRRWGDVH